MAVRRGLRSCACFGAGVVLLAGVVAGTPLDASAAGTVCNAQTDPATANWRVMCNYVPASAGADTVKRVWIVIASLVSTEVDVVNVTTVGAGYFDTGWKPKCAVTCSMDGTSQLNVADLGTVTAWDFDPVSSHTLAGGTNIDYPNPPAGGTAPGTGGCGAPGQPACSIDGSGIVSGIVGGLGSVLGGISSAVSGIAAAVVGDPSTLDLTGGVDLSSAPLLGWLATQAAAVTADLPSVVAGGRICMADVCAPWPAIPWAAPAIMVVGGFMVLQLARRAIR